MNKIYWVIIAILIVCLLLEKCNHIRDVKDKEKQTSEIILYKDFAKHYKNEFDKEVAFNQSLLIDSQKNFNNLMQSKNKEIAGLVKKFKKVSSVTSVGNVIQLPPDIVKLPDSIPCDFTPIDIKVKKEFFSYDFTINNKELRLNSLEIFDEESIVVGTKKLGLFKGKEHRIEVVHSNPYVKTVKLGNYVLNEKPKWYEKTSTKVVGGFIFGVGTTLYFIFKIYPQR